MGKPACTRKKIIEAQPEYANALRYIDIYYSSVRWKTPVDISKEFANLGTKTERLREIKDQMRMRIIGLGWHDLRPGWSKVGNDHSPEYFCGDLIKGILPEEETKTLPKAPSVDPHTTQRQ